MQTRTRLQTWLEKQLVPMVDSLGNGTRCNEAYLRVSWKKAGEATRDLSFVYVGGGGACNTWVPNKEGSAHAYVRDTHNKANLLPGLEELIAGVCSHIPRLDHGRLLCGWRDQQPHCILTVEGNGVRIGSARLLDRRGAATSINTLIHQIKRSLPRTSM